MPIAVKYGRQPSVVSWIRRPSRRSLKSLRRSVSNASGTFANLKGDNEFRISADRGPKPSITDTGSKVLCCFAVALLATNKSPLLVGLYSFARKIAKNSVLIPGSRATGIFISLQNRRFADADDPEVPRTLFPSIRRWRTWARVLGSNRFMGRKYKLTSSESQLYIVVAMQHNYRVRHDLRISKIGVSGSASY